MLAVVLAVVVVFAVVCGTLEPPQVVPPKIKLLSRATRHGKASAQVRHPESFSPIGTSRQEELRSEYHHIFGFFKENFISFFKKPYPDHPQQSFYL